MISVHAARTLTTPHPGLLRAQAARAGRRTYVAVGLAATGILAIHLFSLLRFPAPFVDEAWGANRAWALLQTGRAFGTMDAGVVERYDGYWTYMPLLGTAIHAAAVALFGPTLEAMRLTSLLFGSVLVVAVYGICAHVASRRAGLVAAFLLALSPPFLQASHLGRHDVVIAALGFAAIWLYLVDAAHPSRLPLRSALAGLLASLAVDVHANAIVYLLALGLLFLVDHGQAVACGRPLLSLLRMGRLWAFAAGAAAGSAYYLWVHVFSNPGSFLSVGRLGPGPARIPPFLILDPALWLQSVLETILALLLYSTWMAPLVVLSFIYLVCRRNTADKRPLTLFAVLSLSFAAIIRAKAAFYVVLITPAAVLLVAQFLDHVVPQLFAQRRARSLVAFAQLALLTSLLILGTALALASALSDSREDLVAASSRLGELIPPNATVMGPQAYWFALPPSQRYLSWEQLVYYRQDTPGSTLEAAFRALNPDYFILDSHVEQFVGSDVTEVSHLAHYGLFLDRNELDMFLRDHTQLVARVATETYGSVRLYRVTSDAVLPRVSTGRQILLPQ